MWAMRHVGREGKYRRGCYGKHEGKRIFVKPSRKWQDIIKTDVIKI